MARPLRTHLISLSLVLGLAVSLVWGRTPSHLTIGRETVTGPLPITMVGNAKLPQSLSLVCHTDDATNTVWIFPDGTEVTRQPNATFPEDSIFIYFRHPIDTNQVYLRRKQNVHSPGGSYCCGSATNVTMRLCIDLVVDCETPPTISNGSPEASTATLLGENVTYTCNNGYMMSQGVSVATVSCLATGNWETIPICLAICPNLLPLTNGVINYLPPGNITLDSTIATHICNGATSVSSSERVCQSNGTWSGDPFACLGFNITPSESTPILGKSYSLTFFLTGAESLNFITAISYRWTRDSTVVGNGSATLTFDPLLLSDSGQYKYEVTVMVKSRPETIIFLGEFDVAIPTVFIQLLFHGIHNCPEYRESKANEILQDVTNGLVEDINELCQCDLDSSHITKSFLQCFTEDPGQVAFRAQLSQTTRSTTKDLVLYLNEWIRSPGQLLVQGSLLQLNTTCSQVITDQFRMSICAQAQSGNETATPPCPSCPQCDSTAAIASSVVVILIVAFVLLAVSTVAIAYFVSKQQRAQVVNPKKYTPAAKLREKCKTLPCQPKNIADDNYEEVDVSCPPKGSYEYSQCQAYATTNELLDVVNDTSTTYQENIYD